MPSFDLDALEPAALVAVAVALVLVQTAFVIGFLVPGGKAAVLSGVMAGVGQVPLLGVYASVAAAAVLGATAGYVLGRVHGTRLLDVRVLRPHRERLDRVQDLMRRRAPAALLAGRSVAVLRATTPALAGAARVAPARFLLWNLVGGLAWAALTVGSGYLGGAALPSVAESAPRFALAFGLAVLAVAALVALVQRARRTTPEVR